MADLTNIEKRQFEKLLGMSGGYVLNFSNRTFDEFVTDSTGKSIYERLYEVGGESKANRLRTFWSVEPNHIIGRLLDDLLLYAVELVGQVEQEVLAKCQRTVHRLKQCAPVSEIQSIVPNSPDRDFASLAKSVREAIDKNEPETGLDRLSSS